MARDRKFFPWRWGNKQGHTTTLAFAETWKNDWKTVLVSITTECQIWVGNIIPCVSSLSS